MEEEPNVPPCAGPIRALAKGKSSPRSFEAAVPTAPSAWDPLPLPLPDPEPPRERGTANSLSLLLLSLSLLSPDEAPLVDPREALGCAPRLVLCREGFVAAGEKSTEFDLPPPEPPMP